MIERPILGISMGDPFGNGPEITVKALNDKTIYDRCRPLIVGDKTSMEYALAVAKKVDGIDLKLNVVETPADGKYEYGTIDLDYQVHDRNLVKFNLGIACSDYSITFGDLKGFIIGEDGTKYEIDDVGIGEDRSMKLL